MGIRNFFNRDKARMQEVEIPSAGVGFDKQTFSTPFLKVGKGNLSMPKVDRFYKQGNYVMFGSDNLYPQLLNQMYFTSAIHQAAIDTLVNAAVGGGYQLGENLTVMQKVDVKKFEHKNKFKKMFRTLARDLAIHSRITVIVHYKNGNVKLERVDPSEIRTDENKQKHVRSKDWSKGLYMITEYDSYDGQKADGTYLWLYEQDTPGQDIYPIPHYNSILNYAQFSGDVAFFLKNNMQNSIFPSLVIRRRKKFQSVDEINEFKAGISKQKGAENAGNIIVLAGSGEEDTPEFQQIKANNNTDIFNEAIAITRDEICFGHRINPAIIGIKVPGGLGNAQELEIAYGIYEKNVVMPFRNELEEVYNELIDITGLEHTLVINEFKLIELTDDVESESVEMSGDNSTKSQQVNEQLRGLTAKENADIYRIARDYSREKIPLELAIQRLGTYGIDRETAKKILK